MNNEIPELDQIWSWSCCSSIKAKIVSNVSEITKMTKTFHIKNNG